MINQNTQAILDRNTDVEAKARLMRERFMAAMPEFRGNIADLVRLGLIEGWRNVRRVGARDTRSVTLDKMVIHKDGKVINWSNK